MTSTQAVLVPLTTHPALLSEAECRSLRRYLTPRLGRLHGDPESNRYDSAWFDQPGHPAMVRAGRFLRLRAAALYGPEPVELLFCGLRYSVGGRKPSHADYMNGLRGVSMTVQLSASHEYTGGDLVLTWHGSAARGMGTATLFGFEREHEVREVTAGVRWSLAAWCMLPRRPGDRASSRDRMGQASGRW